MQPVKKFIMKEDPKHIRISEFNLHPFIRMKRIRKFPLPVRDQSKLLVYRHGEVSEDRFTSLPSYLPTGSLMIFNNTKVIQARLHFRKENRRLSLKSFVWNRLSRTIMCLISSKPNMPPGFV